MDLILDVETLRRAVAGGAVFRYRFFWGHRARKDGQLSDACFSQWWPSRFVASREEYSSAEQFMMAGKARLFEDEDTRRRILAANDPSEVKQLGREVRGFNEAAWARARFDLVTRGNIAKFGQDEALRRYLLDTGDDVLVEASPTDRVWGIGLAREDQRASDPAAWQGLNLLGFALVRARAVLRGESPPPAPA